MTLDPQAQAIADALAALPMADAEMLSVADFRQMLADFPLPPPAEEPLASIEDGTLAGAAGALPMRVYRPTVAPGLPLTVFFHGGGFVGGGLDSHDGLCRALAARTGSIVIAVDYRLAPEHRFPAAVEDAVAAVRWVQANAAALGGDAGRIALAGDSAGANLAAVAARQLREARPAIRHQLLIYPVTDSACDSPSHRQYADSAPLLTAPMMRWFWRHYLADARDGADPRASPLREPDLHGLAPATIITAEVDPLRDEGEAYASALQQAGVAVALRRWPGQFHGFVSLLGALDAAAQALDFGATQLKGAFRE